MTSEVERAVEPIGSSDWNRAALDDAVREVQLRAGVSNVRGKLAEAGLACTIGVTSANVGEGKTTLALALATSLVSDLDVPVALIDADFMTHSIGETYGIESREGLFDVLAGSATLEQVAYRVAPLSLDVLTAGCEPLSAAHMARTPLAPELLEAIKGQYTFVVIDLPATLPSALSPAIAALCDFVFVVVQTGRTTRQDLDRALDKLGDAPVTGVILNRWQTRIPKWLERLLGLKR